jgi:hypothetical protein
MRLLLPQAAGKMVRPVAKLIYHVKDLLLGFLAYAGMILDAPANRGGRNVQLFSYVVDSYFFFNAHTIGYVLVGKAIKFFFKKNLRNRLRISQFFLH